MTFVNGFLFGWTALDPPIPYAVPELFVVRGSTPLTELVGPTPLVALVFGGVLLALATRTPVVETTAASVALRE